MNAPRVIVDERLCRICGERVNSDGLYLRGGKQVHVACAQANFSAGGVRIPKVDPRAVDALVYRAEIRALRAQHEEIA